MTSDQGMTIDERLLRELLDACLLWAEDRHIEAGDLPAKFLKAAIVQVFPEIIVTKETCECGGECDECPSMTDVVKSIVEVKREVQQYLTKRALAMGLEAAKKDEADSDVQR